MPTMFTKKTQEAISGQYFKAIVLRASKVESEKNRMFRPTDMDQIG